MKTMKIMQSEGQVIPFNLVKEHEQQVMKNHGQTVARICERGGLDWKELYWVLNDMPYSGSVNMETAKTDVLMKIDYYNKNFMAHAIQSEKYGLRPCNITTVENGKRINTKKAYFHRWVEKSELHGASPMIGGHPGGTVQYVIGLVEFEDGSIDEVHPKNIKFIDWGVE